MTVTLALCVYFCMYSICQQFTPGVYLKITFNMWQKLGWFTENIDHTYCFFSLLFLLAPFSPLTSLSASFLCHHCFPCSFLHQSAFLPSEQPVISCPNEWRGVWFLLLFSLLLSTVFVCLNQEDRLSLKRGKVGGNWPGKTQGGGASNQPFQLIRPLGSDR